ncbi:unconventional myosin-Va isoform X1 [Hydra vulgaris]|uniref:unconventional myosin-Va isoform X1 n=1 Tax=Hydra vulgaris TaxID=6087 RepID=UPI001F5F4ED3|nr:unconventional myosin-Va [Hydra vulgaris]XP_047130705.1 unconventional myosin-Va [Hydra vulgaris]
MSDHSLYVKGTRIWIPDIDEVWIGGFLQNDICNGKLEIELEDGREFVLDLNESKCDLPPLRNPEILVGVNDLTTLSYLHEPAVLYNLKERFVNSQAIYTYCGIVLVAINPYQSVPIYGSDIIAAYNGRQIGEMDPHIFAVAEDAFKNMVNLGKNQSIIVSGESGAGKTVSAKYTMRYFANVGGSQNETTIEQKVLASNPIMEAIGNAKTIRNDNSSRFGKYIEINFNDNYNIVGANMRTYLLEKSRVVYQAPNERNYHIFYQLCSHRNLPCFQELNLKSVDDFFYTQQGKSPSIKDVDDLKCFQETCEALELLGIYSEQQRMLWRILAAILHLGNVDIVAVSKSKDECSIKVDDSHVRMVSSLLGIDCGQLCKWLCARKIIATGEVYVKPLTWHEANNGRDALAKHIYAQLFDWIVEHVNSNLAMASERKSFIGVLDIYGFETFQVNSFEQFCINYANEKLQQQFNQHVFKLEQMEYVKEQIQWSFIDFYDNQPCLDLIEEKLGILDLLDEECRMPKGSDASWASKLYKHHLKNGRYFEKPRMSDVAFIIRHYADDVVYDCNGFVEKNRDTINEEHLSLLRASEYELVGELFGSKDFTDGFIQRKRTTSRVGKTAPKGKKTVGSQFRDSLTKLMEALNSTSPHYIRCIKSNDRKAPFELDSKRCVQQLRACGVLETIRISASGYPSRWSYQEFFYRYRILVPWKKIKWDNLIETCRIILDNVIQNKDKFQCGKTKIFFRAGQVAYLEKLRNDVLRDNCIKIQKNVKGWLMYRKYHCLKKASIKIQAWFRGRLATRLVNHMRRTRAATNIQKRWRGYFARTSYTTIRNQFIIIQAHIRGLLIRRKLKAYIQWKKSIIIQKNWRRYYARKEYLSTRKSIILLQCCIRRMAARKELKKLKIEARSVEHLKTVSKGMEIKIITLQEKLNAEKKEKEYLKQKVDSLMIIEQEAQDYKEIKSIKEQLEKSFKNIEKENNRLQIELNVAIETTVNLTKDKEMLIATSEKEVKELKLSIEDLMKTLEIEKSKCEAQSLDHKLHLQQCLDEQRKQMEAEFSVERASHQKMLGDFARLEQRFMNLQEEQIIEKSPEKRQKRSFADSDKNLLTGVNDEKLNNLVDELSEVLRERDMLLEQVELLKDEQKVNLNISKDSEYNATNKQLLNENNLLKNENEQMKQQLIVMTNAVENDDKLAKDGMVPNLLKQIKELREENTVLRKKLDKFLANQMVGNVTNNNNMSDLAEKEISRLTVENLHLHEEIEKFEAQLKALSSQNSRNTLTNKGELQHGIVPRSKSNVSDLRRHRSTTTIENRIADGSLSEAAKLCVTYAGLTRKKTGTLVQSSTPPQPVRAVQGMLNVKGEYQEKVINKLITELHPSQVDKEVPGFPAHLLFMGIRYIDHNSEERLMQSYLTAVISGIKKKVLKHSTDIEVQSFWLNNTFRLCCNMKQYSGEPQFQNVNSREQNKHCLKNFDLSEYRQVLSDTCIKIYQDMVYNIQQRITNLIVPGMLEYESIPGVVSTLRKFKSDKKIQEEIVTVKDITNKLTAILAVLNAHCVHPTLIKQIFTQIYYFINATMINNVLLRKDMCHWSRGLQIRFNVTQLEEWCRTNQLHESDLLKQLEPITEVVQILQVNKKSVEDADGIIAIVKSLNALQVQKILTMYTPPNEYEPRVPSSLIKAVMNKMKKEDNACIMFDLKYINPMTVPFIPSTVVFDKLEIPESLELAPVTII